MRSQCTSSKAPCGPGCEGGEPCPGVHVVALDEDGAELGEEALLVSLVLLADRLQLLEDLAHACAIFYDFLRKQARERRQSSSSSLNDPTSFMGFREKFQRKRTASTPFETPLGPWRESGPSDRAPWTIATNSSWTCRRPRKSLPALLRVKPHPVA